jgi:hypothetical protein
MRAVIAAVAIVISAAISAGGCNNPGTCPAASQVVQGGSCSGDNLQCPYTLQSGTDAGGLATSCVCQDGTWACPSAGDGGEEAGEDAGDSSVVETGAQDGTAGDSAPAEASSPESGADAGGSNDAGLGDSASPMDASDAG